jgi:hypothetical protein
MTQLLSIPIQSSSVFIVVNFNSKNQKHNSSFPTYFFTLLFPKYLSLPPPPSSILPDHESYNFLELGEEEDIVWCLVDNELRRVDKILLAAKNALLFLYLQKLRILLMIKYFNSINLSLISLRAVQ